jgi:HK97 family phage portal protein
MKFWLFGKKKSVEEPQNADSSWAGLSYDQWVEVLGGVTASSGKVVNEDTAMRCSAVYACVRLISSAVACAPVKIYLRDGDNRKRTPGHPLEAVLRLRPNRFMTASTFWKFMVSSKLLAGNAYANIIRGPGFKPVGLYPHLPHNVEVYFAWELGLDTKLGVERNRRFYHVTFEDGGYSLYDQDDMLHFVNAPGVGSAPSKKGVSTVRAMADAVGLAMGAEESSAKFFANGMMAQLALEYPKPLTPEAGEKLREYITKKYSGSGNHHTPLILQNGGQAKTLSMSAEDAQLLDSRKFSVIDICRFFGVNPVMVGESEKVSSWGSGVEQMGRWFNTLTLNEHFTAIEQEVEIKICGDGHFAEFDETELTRGDTKTRGDFYRVARGSMQEPGFMTINEIRASEGLPPVEGGDQLQRPEIGSSNGGQDNAEQ